MKRENGIQSPSARIAPAMRSASSRECPMASGGGGGRMGSTEDTQEPSATLRITFFSGGDYSMQQRAVLITGAGRRIGAATARAVHAAGANVVLHCHRSRAEAEFLAATLKAARPDSCAIVQGDLLDTEGLPRLVEAAARAFGRLDGLVNNASSFAATPFGEISPAQWDDLVGTNLRAPLFLAQAAAARLREARGAIVNLVDIHAERPL